jgi:hypothetical protein
MSHSKAPRRLRRLLTRLGNSLLRVPVGRAALLFALVAGGFALGLAFSARALSALAAARLAVARAAPRPAVSALMRPADAAGGVVLLSSAYESGDAARDDERARVVAKNAALRSVAEVRMLTEFGDGAAARAVRAAVGGVKGAAPVGFVELAKGRGVTYARLFAYANEELAGRAVVLHNADIFFDESIACAGLLRAERRVVLALSRHPSPDCVYGSGHGDTGFEAQDLCAGYHPLYAASHDVFAFVPPLPDAFITALGDLRVNQFGAENVVLFNLRHAARVEPINPCANIHAFHAHCDASARAASAHESVGSEAERRRQFSGTPAHGFLDPAAWAGKSASGVDCLLLGLSQPARRRPPSAAASTSTSASVGAAPGAALAGAVGRAEHEPTPVWAAGYGTAAAGDTQSALWPGTLAGEGLAARAAAAGGGPAGEAGGGGGAGAPADGGP